MKKLSVLLVIVMLATALAACGSKVPEACESDPLGCAVIEKGETVKIGMAGPMLGDYAMFGKDISQGAMVAIDEVNAAGGLEGFNFELIAEDTGGSPEQGAAVASKFVTDETMVAIAGHIFSGESEAAMPIYEDAGFPMMSPSATNPPLTQMGSTVFNRLAFTDAVQAKFAAEMLKNDLGVSKLALVHDGSAYGQGLADEVQANFESMGGEVVAYEAVTPGEADYSATLAAIAAAGPEAVYYGGYAAEAIVMANQWAQAGLTGVTLFGCDGTFGVEFTQKTGANGIGSIAASLVPPDSDEKTAFDTAYQTKFGLAAGELSAFTWSAYDTAYTLMNAAMSVAFVDGDTLYIPRSAMVAAVRGTNYNGLTGAVVCDATGECNASGPSFYEVVSDGAGGSTWIPFTK
ncbi:MAG: branched-chain amino acid ABC transporter substrate-binding protein [Anaerolineae bacterium]|jgi:branched-chain amino acid transport system substrate-binding protein|nr:branched-chain amino acid ABC transporter substrate-binding protein [Anaerolineae bacterium]